MPYGNLAEMRVQRFRTLADIDNSRPTIEEREEYELPVREGITVYAGVDYEAVLHLAEQDADVVLWDGGNNDLPFFRPDLMIVLADALRPGHESAFYPGEVNVLLADALVVNKIDTAPAADVDSTIAGLQRLNPTATVLLTKSPPTFDPAASIEGRRVLVVEDLARMPSDRCATSSSSIRTSARCCRRWGTARSNSPSWPPRSRPPRVTPSCRGRRST